MFHVILAIFRRNLSAYFINPTGYVFITVFILAGAAAAFFREEFFRNNLANLNTLNEFFPYILLFFVPAITMSAWAEEKRQGTEELLFTLPASDLEILLGKYLSAVGIYTVSLAFSFSHVAVLFFLGRPDAGLMFSTYLGYWFLGAALISAGMVGSALTSSMPVAYIFGALLCSFFVLVQHVGLVLPASWERAVVTLGVHPSFEEFTSGIVTARGVLYFVSLTVILLYVNLILLSRRRWKEAVRGLAPCVRWVFLVAGLIGLNILTERTRARADITAEQLHSLSKETREMIANLGPERPVFIHAYVSDEVPKDYVQTRSTVLTLLREYEAMGKGKIQLKVYPTEKYSTASRDAEQKFGIRYQTLVGRDEGERGPLDVYLGAAFVCAGQDVVVPFFFKGLSVEYELTRSIRTVANQNRKKVGILSTDAKIFGGLNFQTFQKEPDWELVAELKKQYDVEEVRANDPLPDNLDVLIAPLASSLTQPEMTNLETYIQKGKPILVLDDPFPAFNPGVAPWEQKRPPGGPFMGGGRPPEPKGDFDNVLRLLGVRLDTHQVVWQRYNPHPELRHLPPELVFIGRESGASRPFHPTDPITSGLQEVVLIFPGTVKDQKLPGLTFTPLLQTSRHAGMTDATIFGQQVPEQFLAMVRGDGADLEQTLAARIEGESDKRKVNAIVVGDLDLVSSQFFHIRRENIATLQFDNIPFVLNCVDMLIGDTAIVELRKRRPKHRVLDRIEEQVKREEQRRSGEERSADDKAKARIKELEDRLNQKIKELQESNLDEESKNKIMQEYIEKVEKRRFEAAKAAIEDEKKAAIAKGKERAAVEINRIQEGVRVLAVLLPPIPAFILGIIVFALRIARERQAIPKERWVRS